MTPLRRLIRVTLLCVLAAVWPGIPSATGAVPGAAGSVSCLSSHWVGAWEAPPSDASQGTSDSDVFAPSEDFPPGGAGDVKQPVDDSTVRAILTPTLGGSIVRVHLTNRFGSTPVSFDRVTIGKEAGGATLAGTPVPVSFGGKPEVTAAPGQDVISDPVSFTYHAFQNLAVSIYVSGDAGMPTEHYEARQTSYFTPDGLGDHADDTDGGAFTFYNSTRPFVDGVDVEAPASTGAVVAFGDSITDGYQGDAPAGVPASPDGYNQNLRWPDDLARRLIGARVALSVLNAGISGNRVLLDGTAGGGPDAYGPSALSRLAPDVLGQAGVTTVIWLEGINDIGQTPAATPAQLEAGYVSGIAAMHAAGLKVLLGTLTPSGGDLTSSYGGAAANREREQVNAWIRSDSPADGVIDFDAAVRDPSDPSQINPAFDGGDHLHFDPAGYQAMADAINLALLRRATCTQPALRVTVTPRSVTAGRRKHLGLRVTSATQPSRPISGAMILIAGHRLHTDGHGLAGTTLVFAHSGHVRITATRSGYIPGQTAIDVIAPVHPSRRPRRTAAFTG